MLRFGTVEKTNPQTAQVRVKFDDADGISSYWISVIMPFTVDDKAYLMLVEGTQVACLMDENSEEGVVLGAIYSEADPAPINDLNRFYIEFKDGTVLEYDKQAHKLTADVKGSIEAKATLNIDLASLTTISLSAPNINMSAAGGSTTGAITGNFTITAGDVVADGISLKNHTHFAPHEAGNTGAAQ